MKKNILSHLSRRERQIMDIIYQKGKAAAAEVHEMLPDPPSYSAVRAMLGILEKKGYLKHEEQGPRYIYIPTISQEKVKTKALQHLMQTFFNGSTEKVMAALLDLSGSELSKKELDRLSQMIEKARREGK